MVARHPDLIADHVHELYDRLAAPIIAHRGALPEIAGIYEEQPAAVGLGLGSKVLDQPRQRGAAAQEGGTPRP